MRDFAPNRDIENRMRVLIGSWGCDVLTGGRGTTRSAARTGTTGAPARSSSRGCCAAVPQRRRPPGQGPRGIWRCTATRCRAAGRFGTGPGTSRALVVGPVSQLPRRVRRCRPASAWPESLSRCPARWSYRLCRQDRAGEVRVGEVPGLHRRGASPDTNMLAAARTRARRGGPHLRVPLAAGVASGLAGFARRGRR
jgi:hypothetical protein